MRTKIGGLLSRKRFTNLAKNKHDVIYNCATVQNIHFQLIFLNLMLANLHTIQYLPVSSIIYVHVY